MGLCPSEIHPSEFLWRLGFSHRTMSLCAGGFPAHHVWLPDQWIGLRENSQETHGFLPLNMGVSCKISPKPIHWPEGHFEKNLGRTVVGLGMKTWNEIPSFWRPEKKYPTDPIETSFKDGLVKTGSPSEKPLNQSFVASFGSSFLAPYWWSHGFLHVKNIVDPCWTPKG